MEEWNIEQAKELYRVDSWGSGYFTINEEGNMCVKPSADSPHKVDLKMLIDQLRQRKIQPPVLIRIMNILEDRIAHLSKAFHEAIAVNEYEGEYYPLFPIKVNQERDVVTSVLKYGREFGLGLEAGSKAELLIVLAMTMDLKTPIVCNGYKDREFAALVGMAHKMGKPIVPVIENYEELETFLAYHRETGIMPDLGVRVKLSTRGTGQWAKTGGDTSKFGLRVPEVMQLVRRLEQEGMLDKLKLLHFHIGSQISKIKVVKQAIVETTRVFVELVKLGAGLTYIDIGGGLGVDYSGNSADNRSTINYTLAEYASDIVYRIKQMCDENEIPHPTIFSESGRFLSAHYSLMITNVCSTSSLRTVCTGIPQTKEGYGPVAEMMEILDNMNDKNLMECYHDAQQYKTEALNLFNLGYLSLPDRATMEELFWRIMQNIQQRSRRLDLDLRELDDIDQALSDTYFANFSVFQSLPDSWAINQVFPITPIHRLTESPDVAGVIADLTCDSDGLIQEYIGDGQRAGSVPVHEIKPGEPYYLGTFLIGAYQETLGELHNLFGDPHAVQIEIIGENKYKVHNVIKGDTIHQVVGYVSYSSKELIRKMRNQMETALAEGLLDLDESARLMDLYEERLHGYTYFEV